MQRIKWKWEEDRSAIRSHSVVGMIGGLLILCLTISFGIFLLVIPVSTAFTCHILKVHNWYPKQSVIFSDIFWKVLFLLYFSLPFKSSKSIVFCNKGAVLNYGAILLYWKYPWQCNNGNTHLRLQFNLSLHSKLHVKQCLYDTIEVYMIEITNLRRKRHKFWNYYRNSLNHFVKSLQHQNSQQ